MQSRGLDACGPLRAKTPPLKCSKDGAGGRKAALPGHFLLLTLSRVIRHQRLIFTVPKLKAPGLGGTGVVKSSCFVELGSDPGAETSEALTSSPRINLLSRLGIIELVLAAREYAGKRASALADNARGIKFLDGAMTEDRSEHAGKIARRDASRGIGRRQNHVDHADDERQWLTGLVKVPFIVTVTVPLAVRPLRVHQRPSETRGSR